MFDELQQSSASRRRPGLLSVVLLAGAAFALAGCGGGSGGGGGGGGGNGGGTSFTPVTLTPLFDGDITRFSGNLFSGTDADPCIWVGQDPSNTEHRGLLVFDLRSIPSGSEVRSGAALVLTTETDVGDPMGHSKGIRVERASTFLISLPFNSQSEWEWETDGGAGVDTDLVRTTLPFRLDVTKVIRAALAEGSPEVAFRLDYWQLNASGADRRTEFWSMDSAAPGNWPRLELEIR